MAIGITLGRTIYQASRGEIANVAEGALAIAAAVPIGRALKPLITFNRNRAMTQFPKGKVDGTPAAMKRGRQQIASRSNRLQNTISRIEPWQAGIGTVITVKSAYDFGSRAYHQVTGMRAV